MTVRGRCLTLLVGVALSGASVFGQDRPRSPQATAAQTLPDRLSDTEFWRLVTTFSERGGAFHSDNFTSNEPAIGDLVKALAETVPPGGAYLGVGPEQNFTYIAALHPQIAFVVDIRRQAVLQHLLYKALFELAGDRADFLALLFSEPRPEAATSNVELGALWSGWPTTPGSDEDRFHRNVATVESRLAVTHGFTLDDTDRALLEYVYQAFFKLGPAINYAGYAARLSTADTNFERLSTLTDSQGTLRSFLATEAAFQSIKDLEARNLIVPVEGDFGGPTALRAVGAYLREHGLTVRAFYVSNVEQYLFNPRIGAAPGGQELNGGSEAFYANVEALPLDSASEFLRPPFTAAATLTVRHTLPDGTIQYLRKVPKPLCPILPFLTAVHDGRVTNLQEAEACGQ